MLIQIEIPIINYIDLLSVPNPNWASNDNKVYSTYIPYIQHYCIALLSISLKPTTSDFLEIWHRIF